MILPWPRQTIRRLTAPILRKTVLDKLLSMRKYLLLFSLIFISLVVKAQNDPYDDHPKLTVEDFTKHYTDDTIARAVVINEIGRAAIINTQDNGRELEYKFYTRIKILKSAGTDLATLKIYLRKSSSIDAEEISDISGSSFTLVNNGIKEVQLDPKSIFNTDESKVNNSASFSIPGIVAGSIIEYRYTTHSPFLFSFHSWVFQSDIPKVKSVFTAVIPGIYTFNISLGGSRKLDTQKAELEKGCLVFGNGGVADCSVLTWGMLDLPALHQESFVSAMSDFTPKIDFELVSYLVNSNYTKKVTSTWRDEDRYMQSEEFGLKRSIRFFKPLLDTLIKSQLSDSLKARRIYELLKQHYVWNDIYDSWADVSPKKLWTDRKGMSGELNLALVAALRAAGLNASPLLQSCRRSASPRKLFPVRTDFNNVLAVLDLNGHRYFLDITDKYMPFGFISPEFLSHEGRLFPDGDSSRWIPITPPQGNKNFIQYDLKMSADGSLKGEINEYKYGYDALEERKKRRNFSTQDDYLDAKTKTWKNSRIISYSVNGMDSTEENLHSKFQIEIRNFHADAGKRINFSPFLSPTFSYSLFQEAQRFYPIDFGKPYNETVVIQIQLPAGYKVVSQPVDLQIKLPNDGGFFIMSHDLQDDKYQLSYRFSFLKEVYSAAEYQVLKEFMAQIIKTKQKFMVLEKI